MAELTSNGEAKVERVLRASLSVFARNGIDGASIADIADAAGVSKGSIYLYFDSKEALAGELVRFLFTYEEGGEPSLSEEPKPLQRILKFCTRLQAQVAALKEDASVVVHMFGHVGKSRNDMLGRGIRQLMAESRYMMECLLRNAQRRALIPVGVNVSAAAAAVLACAYGALHQRLTIGGSDLDVREAAALVLRGLGAKV